MVGGAAIRAPDFCRMMEEDPATNDSSDTRNK